MKDLHGREISYMRISLTDRCNFRCKYCMPEEGVPDIGHDSILSLEEVERIVRTAANLGISKYRLTGGEPLVRKGIVSLVRKMSSIPGVSEVAMTTNGSLLSGMAAELTEAGLSRVNISLDTLVPHKFAEITRGGDLDQVLDGINAAMRARLTPVKINVVVMRGFNDDEIMDFVQLTLSHDLHVRFIELMPIGNAAQNAGYEYMSCEEIKSRLPALRRTSEDADGVADVYKYPTGRGTIGFISPISSCFCASCNKIRLTADGKLKTCLHSAQEIDLTPALAEPGSERLSEVIKGAVLGKEERHRMNEGISESARGMNKIGG